MLKPTVVPLSQAYHVRALSYGESTVAAQIDGTVPYFGTSGLARGTVGQQYSSTLASAETTSATFAVPAGALPAGLRLDTSTGLISGTPKRAGTHSFTITARNLVGPPPNDSLLLCLPLVPAPVGSHRGRGQSMSASRKGLLLHGTPLSPVVRDEIAARLAEDRVDVAVPSLACAGDSRAHARRIAATLGPAPVHVVGQSFGGQVALDLALDYPELVASVT